jgi:hypothetical protein
MEALFIIIALLILAIVIVKPRKKKLVSDSDVYSNLLKRNNPIADKFNELTNGGQK